jgi:hypothetical protein
LIFSRFQAVVFDGCDYRRQVAVLVGAHSLNDPAHGFQSARSKTLHRERLSDGVRL